MRRQEEVFVCVEACKLQSVVEVGPAWRRQPGPADSVLEIQRRIARTFAGPAEVQSVSDRDPV